MPWPNPGSASSRPRLSAERSLGGTSRTSSHDDQMGLAVQPSPAARTHRPRPRPSSKSSTKALSRPQRTRGHSTQRDSGEPGWFRNTHPRCRSVPCGWCLFADLPACRFGSRGERCAKTRRSLRCAAPIRPPSLDSPRPSFTPPRSAAPSRRASLSQTARASSRGASPRRPAQCAGRLGTDRSAS